MQKTHLFGLSDIRRYFHRNEIPTYFISATNFNLLGLDEWVRGFQFINHIDCFDGRHPNVFVPQEIPHDQFESIEDINNYMLQHKEVIDFMRQRAKAKGRKDLGKAVFLMFDEKTESLCNELGLEVCFPSAGLRNRVDNKVETVRIGDRAGVPSVPNQLMAIQNWGDVIKAQKILGPDLVIQTAFGDSGHTTFFITSEKDYDKHAKEIASEAVVKVMKRLKCRGSALEACTTRQGTIVGPLMTELVGFKELTPYKGGWCGNEIFPGSFTPELRDQAVDYTFKFGEQLRKEGYRGYFELDFLIDMDGNQLYLGELNPRITGASSMTNHAAFAHADAPLFLFHLLEFADVEFEFDVNDLNRRWADPQNIDDWSQLVVKWTDESVKHISAAPESGIWRLAGNGALNYNRFDYHRRAVETENEAFFLRISGPGDYLYEGADLGILITRGRLMTPDFELTDRAHAFIKGIHGHYKAKPVADVTSPDIPVALSAGAFKIL